MTDHEPPVPASPTADQAITTIDAELVAEDGTRLGRAVGWARSVIRLVEVLILATGVLALLVGLGGWREVPVGMAIVVIACLPAILLPLYVIRRTGALAVAIARPREMAAQARDLVAHMPDTTELRALAGQVARGRGAGGEATGRFRRVRGGFRVARLTSQVIEQAGPDAGRHALLIPFTPGRLAATWSGTVWSLWALLSALVVLLVSVPALIISLL